MPFLDILKEAIGPFIAAVVAFYLYRKDKPTRDEKIQSGEFSRIHSLLNEIQEERNELKKERKELQQELDLLKQQRNSESKIIETLKKRVEVLEAEGLQHIEERKQWEIREKSYKDNIAELRREISELKKKINGMDTGQLPNS